MAAFQIGFPPLAGPTYSRVCSAFSPTCALPSNLIRNFEMASSEEEKCWYG